jgi:hypothetical protein
LAEGAVSEEAGVEGAGFEEAEGEVEDGLVKEEGDTVKTAGTTSRTP